MVALGIPLFAGHTYVQGRDPDELELRILIFPAKPEYH